MCAAVAVGRVCSSWLDGTPTSDPREKVLLSGSFPPTPELGCGWALLGPGDVFFFFNKSVSFLRFRCTASLMYPDGLARLVPHPIWEAPSSRKCPGPSSREYALQVTRVPPPPSSAPEVTGGVNLWTLSGAVLKKRDHSAK